MRTIWLESLIVLGVCLVAAAGASAQPLFAQAQSIESTVANADLVFVAKLVKVGDEPQADEPGVYEVGIAIEETVKQGLFTYEPYTRLAIKVRIPAAALADWQKRSCRLLVAHDSDVSRATEIVELAEGKMEVMTADMTLLRDPAAVLRAARDAARRMPANVKRIHTFGLRVPRERVAGTTWEKVYATSGHLVLKVPVDQQLEKRALDYLRSDSPSTRGEGAQALRYFRSDQNIARIKALLGDPGRITRHLGQDGQGVEAFYLVRDQAYETLKVWGVEVAKPVIYEEVPE